MGMYARSRLVCDKVLVIEPEEIIKQDFDYVFVTALDSFHMTQITQRLLELGVTKDRICMTAL